ncbi:MAG: IS1634 family transposase [Nanoarchaeota archaeon]|nr:IS1634 family transposase [Euryarchaeota archaeon]MBU4501606.1 IS1634 family transposase [Nanoarchaeota archaeon]
MISTFTLNHFGIVAGTCKELKISEVIDSLIPPDPQQKVTTGQAIVSMIINGLGFSNRRLYLYPQFFENKPVHLLLGNNIESSDLNDDTIGRAMDRVFKYGCTELFCYVASAAAKAEEVSRKFGHLDTTTFSVHGDYKSSAEEGVPIHITYGHSKQKRPDLKQIFLNLLVSSDGAVPLFMQALNGNSSDVTVFRNTVKEFKKGLKENLKEITYLIADSKFYTEKTLKEADGDLLWISRVPDTITEAKKAINETVSLLDTLLPLEKEGYSYRKCESSYGSVAQRWLIVHSKEAEKRAKYSIERKVKKEFEKIRKEIKRLERKGFTSDAEAMKASVHNQKKIHFHDIKFEGISEKASYKGRGRPSKHKEKKITYFIRYIIGKNEVKIDLEIKKKAIFIIATNELSEEKLSDEEVFENYKGQKHVERGFRFLKDPLFFASSLFLKKPRRIVSLTMIMCLSLLVYSLCERKMRSLLKEHKETIMNQLKKPTQRPTLRWVFELFEDIHLVRFEDEWRYEVKNLRPDGIKILKILGKEYMEPYLITLEK